MENKQGNRLIALGHSMGLLINISYEVEYQNGFSTMVALLSTFQSTKHDRCFEVDLVLPIHWAQYKLGLIK